MALPSTGSISMSQVNTELKKSATAKTSLNDSDVRKLAAKPSGQITMSDLRGKKNTESVTDYQLYNYSGKSPTSGILESVTINSPKKIISGYLTIVHTWQRNSDGYSGYLNGYIEVLNQRIQNTTKKINVNNIKSFVMKWLKGYSYTESDNITFK